MIEIEQLKQVFIYGLSQGDVHNTEWKFSKYKCTINFIDKTVAGNIYVKFDDGEQQWILNGKRHRTNGPAIIYSNVNYRYYINNEYLTYNEFKQWQVDNDI